MNVRIMKGDDTAAWNSYVMSSPHSNSYHQIGWKNIIEKSFGHKTYYLIAESNSNNINGTLPLVHIKSKVFGNYMVSLPYFNYGGICTDNKEAYSCLLSEAIRIAKEDKTEHIELRHTEENAADLPVKKEKVSMRLSLPKESNELWKSLPSKLRSQIRRPEKEEMVVKIGREEELDSFYEVFSVNMRDLGTPVYSKDFFRNILKEFSSSTWICSVYTKDGKPTASGFLVGFKDIIEIPWASSQKKYNPYSPNMLLYWNIMKFACENGYSVFDFGRSTPGEGTYRFKEQWGAQPVQLYWHYWLRNGGRLPELNPKNPKYQMAIKIWKKLPVPITNIIGPKIVKNLP
jgi:serine/alanine adding enzyme